MTTRRPRPLSLVIVTAAVSSALLIGCGADRHGRSCSGHAGKDLSSRTVAGADLWQKKLRCVNLERSTVTGLVSEANLRRGNLYAGRLAGASLENVDLRGADLRRADLTSATLSQVDLRGADLSGAALGKALLTDVSLDGARLAGTDLRAASLSHVGLTAADLRGADLAEATVSDSDLRGARLRKADVSTTSWENVLCPDGSRSSARNSCADHPDRAAARTRAPARTRAAARLPVPPAAVPDQPREDSWAAWCACSRPFM
ncbi:pentapeptide repeat-containing protein [Streptomyces sp. S465]|uniref:pentapeptide repeat-containing protein n=1 Tax=Streptomyces sp. S465 TaxID=2979468 RepID=UPI0022A8A215|nr:pentapeptide repeat-containing protein [Streptomyces sp. S465]WAP53927.1 pentapeptide repeat-containing protein [Streptomyces sp. S465]